jgi:hypothetical protein
MFNFIGFDRPMKEKRRVSNGHGTESKGDAR